MSKRGKVIVLVTLLTLGMYAATASGAGGSGTVRLPQDMTIDLGFALAGNGEPAVLPPGGYTLRHWSIRRTDERNTVWTCEGDVPSDKSLLQVIPGQETELPVGEPLVSTLTATRRGAEVTFSHALQGRLGEMVEIAKGEERVPPRLRITNADGSYDRTLTFAFG